MHSYFTLILVWFTTDSAYILHICHSEECIVLYFLYVALCYD